MHPTSEPFKSSPLHFSEEVVTPLPLKQSDAVSHSTPISSVYQSNDLSIESYCSSSSNISVISERLNNTDINSPSKLFQNKHAIHQFENVTPDVSAPSSPSAAAHVKLNYDARSSPDIQQAGSYTPRSSSSESSITQHENSPPQTFAKDHYDDNIEYNSVTTESAPTSRPTTPSQFVFKKPEYDSHYHHTHFHHLEKKDTIFNDLRRFFKKGHGKKKKSLLVEDASGVRSSNSSVYSKHSDLSFANEFNKNIQSRYGKWGQFVGKGSGGSVRIIRRNTDGKTFAVKEFRKKASNENEKEYIKKVTAEFCIGSTLHNSNVIEALDIIQEGHTFYEIMEYAPNDLFTIVMSGKMEPKEISCCWRQLLDGVKYLQGMGIAHRDLKLDNLVLDERGIVKIIDFGCSTVIKYPFEETTHMSKGICGSDPYIAPEQYTQKEYDARKTDLWSCGIIYVCMTIRRFPWKTPCPEKDQSYSNFVRRDNSGAEKLFKLLPRYARPIVSRILCPDPAKRCTLADVMEDEWIKNIETCSPEVPARNHQHHLLVKPSKEIMARGNIVILPPARKET
ncbi:hypothetical protein MFLAVUS_003488 [Mucor flavus]|uniref:non-specific serine/threonine protein kinase n=1 Tax=Mucor flavus TaxID=439312 RepID=A0ABP9YT94_9FUNG